MESNTEKEKFVCEKGCCKLNFMKPINSGVHKFSMTFGRQVSKDSKDSKVCTKRESAGVAILKNEKDQNGKQIKKILLTQAYNNMWGVPKGKQEHGETLMKCACREVLEEAGIDISTESLQNSSVIKFTPAYDKNLTIHIFVYKMTDIDTITWDLENINMDNLHFDSTGLGWANLNCLMPLERSGGEKTKPKLNALTRFVTKKLTKV